MFASNLRCAIAKASHPLLTPESRCGFGTSGGRKKFHRHPTKIPPLRVLRNLPVLQHRYVFWRIVKYRPRQSIILTDTCQHDPRESVQTEKRYDRTIG